MHVVCLKVLFFKSVNYFRILAKDALRGISHLAAVLVHDYADAFDAEGARMADLLIDRVKRLDALIDGIRQYAEVRRDPEQTARIALGPLVRDVIAAPGLPEHIQCVVQNDLPDVVGQPALLALAFRHLLNNAVQYMDKLHGEITVRCVQDDPQWTIAVADNGPGIDEKYHGKIFHIFQTLESGNTGEHIGVGLALVKKIVDVHGGAIRVAMQPGEGSTFFVTLPKPTARE